MMKCYDFMTRLNPRCKVVYVIGPIRARWRIKRWLNVYRARNTAVKLWKAGFAVVCPHLNSLTLRHQVGEDELVAGDLRIVSRCDFVVMTGDCRHSKGAVLELELARDKRNDIRIYTSAEQAVVNE